MQGLEGCSCLTALNGIQCEGLLSGGLVKLDLTCEEPGFAVSLAPYLPRSASTLTSLKIRFVMQTCRLYRALKILLDCIYDPIQNLVVNKRVGDQHNSIFPLILVLKIQSLINLNTIACLRSLSRQTIRSLIRKFFMDSLFVKIIILIVDFEFQFPDTKMKLC